MTAAPARTRGRTGVRAPRPTPPRDLPLSRPHQLSPREISELTEAKGPLTYPVYIPTRGRPQVQLTATKLLSLGISPVLVVPPDDPREVQAYRDANPDCLVIPYPAPYFTRYERTPEMDPHPTTGAAHNFAWDHSRAAGFQRHWIMDDNIRFFWKRTSADPAPDRPQPGARRQGVRTRVKPTDFVEMERTAARFSNLAGLSLGQGGTFSDRPFMVNTRLYCATLYRNDLDLPPWNIVWRRGINDDTVVSLDILKTGYWCTAETRILGIAKVPTSHTKRLAGGMTDFYGKSDKDKGFARKAAEAVRLHPDCVRTSERFGRTHHFIDYRQFTQQLIPLPGPTTDDCPPDSRQTDVTPSERGAPPNVSPR